MSQVTIKKGDTANVIRDTLAVDDVAYDLTGATVLFKMRSLSGTDSISATATIVSAAAGTVSYTPVSGDVDQLGDYRQEWEVTKAGLVLTFPIDDYNVVTIIEDADTALSLVNPYCTLDELKRHLKFPLTDASRDQDLIESINAASRWMDTYAGRDWYQHDYSSTALEIDQHDDMSYGETIFLPWQRIVSLTQVTQDGDVLESGTDYVAKYDIGRVISLGGNWNPSRPDNLVTMTGVFGYAQSSSAAKPSDLPADIVEACKIVAGVFSGHNKKEVVGLDGIVQEVRSQEIPQAVKDMLGRRAPILI